MIRCAENGGRSHERVREGEGNTISQGCGGRDRSHPAAGRSSMLLGVYPVVGIILLIIFLLGVSFQMHAYSASCCQFCRYRTRIQNAEITSYKRLPILIRSVLE